MILLFGSFGFFMVSMAVVAVRSVGIDRLKDELDGIHKKRIQGQKDLSEIKKKILATKTINSVTDKELETRPHVEQQKSSLLMRLSELTLIYNQLYGPYKKKKDANEEEERTKRRRAQALYASSSSSSYSSSSSSSSWSSGSSWSGGGGGFSGGGASGSW